MREGLADLIFISFSNTLPLIIQNGYWCRKSLKKTIPKIKLKA